MTNQGVISEGLSQDLRLAVKQLKTVNPWVGLGRFMVLGILFVTFVTLAWQNYGHWVFGVYSAIAGLLYAFWLICTHDSSHYTLTGWTWFEEIAPRLLSYPMLWPYGVYSELHILHHGWNGVDFRDPERIQWTKAEYEQASPLWRWYVRYQWPIDILILGGIGLILKTLLKGWRLQFIRSRLRWQMTVDLVTMALIHSFLAVIAISTGVIWHYLLFWFILERSIGIVIQTRDHLEHYRMWTQKESHQLTQLYACRNLKVNSFIQWLMGGLPYHAVHHCFPDIPFNKLPQAFEEIQAVLKQYNLPMMTLETRYWQTTWQLSLQPAIITTIQGEHQNI